LASINQFYDKGIKIFHPFDQKFNSNDPIRKGANKPTLRIHGWIHRYKKKAFIIESLVIIGSERGN
jgi:hypothetical protein